MDPDLKQYLEGMETRITGRFDDVEKRLDGFDKRLDGFDKRLDGFDKRLGALEDHIGTLEERIMNRIDGRIDAVEARLKDFVLHAVADMETKLIGEFWKWGRTSDLRTKQSVMELNVLNERVLAVEDRITALERGQ